MELSSLVDRCFLINLDRRPDRLEHATNQVEKASFPFQPVRVRAIDGERVNAPRWFRSGNGAWGCARSHLHILEQAMMDGLDCVWILEDDLYFPRPESFVKEVKEFMNIVPDDWGMLMFGGQHMGSSATVKEGVVRCINTQRTHCYVVRGKAIPALYQLWSNAAAHIDHSFPQFMSAHKVYGPSSPLVGQMDGHSDITCTVNAKKLWRQPKANPAVYYFKNTPRETIETLRKIGFHFGNTRDQRGQDVGLEPIWRECNWRLKPTRLRTWLEMIHWEAASEELLGTSIWHENVDEKLLREVIGDKLIVLDNPTVEHAVQTLKTHGGAV